MKSMGVFIAEKRSGIFLGHNDDVSLVQFGKVLWDNWTEECLSMMV